MEIRPKRVLSIVTLVSFIVTTTFTFNVDASENRVVYPLKEISKLKCRFDDFESLDSDCKEELPILKTKDYKKYIEKDGGYNEFTRLYTVLWGSSYKYGWDVGHGGHEGVDIATAKGTPVYSIAKGIVIVAKKDPSWGNVVSIKHTIRGKEVVSNYAHLDRIYVKKGDIIKAGVNIGTVGSTGNSTGNHLHFQIDLAHIFHPFYYSWKTCPYGYYTITEKGVCFDELAEHTFDPLEFLEGEGAILDHIEIKTIKKAKNNVQQKGLSFAKEKTSGNNTLKGFDMNIFNQTVHTEIGSNKTDIKKVQKIYKDLGYYKEDIDGDYSKLESAIIDYQLDNKIISSKSENGAGWFGPKTRAHTKSSYIKYLNTTEAKKRGDTKVYVGTEEKVATKRKVEKISRTNILSREEIEKREVDEFIKNNEINITLGDVGGNIKVGSKFKVKLEVLKKINRKKRKAYKGALPAPITFEINEKVISVFPKKMTYISNGTRDIQLTGLKAGNTKLKVKIGKTVLKTFELKVFGETSKIYPKTAQVLAQKRISLGEKKTGIVLFKDDAGKKLVNLKFNGTFIVKTGDDTKVCIKKGSLKKIGKVYKSECKDSDYVSNPEVRYSDTVGGLLIFDYKALSTNKSTIDIVGKGSGKSYSKLALNVSIPKGLTKKYEYYDETVDMLEKGIASGTKKGYFMEKKGLTNKEALVWIENALVQIKEGSTNPDTRAQVNKKLIELGKDKDRSYREITRKQFLDKAYKYLVINDAEGISIEYKDLMEQDNKKANAIFDRNNTWKDKFGEEYFQPKQKLTRGEGAFLLSKTLDKSERLYLTLK